VHRPKWSILRFVFDDNDVWNGAFGTLEIDTDLQIQFDKLRRKEV
jgi:hypothetical protein